MSCTVVFAVWLLNVPAAGNMYLRMDLLTTIVSAAAL